MDVGKGTACRDRCETDVAILNELVGRSQSAHAIAGTGYRRNGSIYALLGGVCLAFAVIEWRSGIGWFLVPTGLVFLLGAYQQYTAARKYGRNPGA